MGSSELPLRLHSAPACLEELLPLLDRSLTEKPLSPLQQGWLTGEQLSTVDEDVGLVAGSRVTVEAEDVAAIGLLEPTVHGEMVVRLYLLSASPVVPPPRAQLAPGVQGDPPWGQKVM